MLAVALWNVFPITLEPLVGLTAWERTDDSEKKSRTTLAALVAEVAGDFAEVALDQKVVAGHPAEELFKLSADACVLVVGARRATVVS